MRVGEAAGAMLGPVALGRIFDLTSSYRPAFGLCILCATVGAAATLGCQKFSPAATIANEVLSAAGSPLRISRPATTFAAPHSSCGLNSHAWLLLHSDLERAEKGAGQIPN